MMEQSYQMAGRYLNHNGTATAPEQCMHICRKSQRIRTRVTYQHYFKLPQQTADSTFSQPSQLVRYEANTAGRHKLQMGGNEFSMYRRRSEF